jgi:hypothetical protein
MAATIIPTAAVTVDGKPTITGYIVETWDIAPGGTPDQEEIKDGAGAHHSIVVFENRMDEIDFALIVTTGDTTEFKNGALCTATGYTDYQCRNVRVAKSKGAQRITGQLVKVQNFA